MFTSLNPRTLSFEAPLEEALQLARANGFKGLDLPLDELLVRSKQTSITEIQERFQEANIRPGGWSLPVDIRSADEVYQAELSALPYYAALAQELGSFWCTTWLLPFSDTLNTQENMEWHIQRLQPIARILADHHCQLGLEFVGPSTLRAGHRYPFVHTMTEALELGDRLGTNNTGILLDSFHWYTSHASVADLLTLPVERIISVHLNDGVADRDADEQLDGERMLPGSTGVINIIGFLQALQQLKYQGPVVVEPFNADLNALPTALRVQMAASSLSTVFKQAGIQM